MGYKYRRYYIPAGGTLVALFLALQLWGLQIIDISGDIYCTDTCVSYFDVRNPTYRSIYIYNRDEVKMDFIPTIKDYQLYVKYYGKWVPMDFTLETRLGNVPKDRIYTFVFPRYSVKHFKLVGKKEDWKNIKWTFGTSFDELDPNWISGIEVGDKIVKELCVPSYGIEETHHYKKCDCDIKNVSCVSAENECYDYTTHKAVQVDCRKTGKVNVSGKVIEEKDRWCKLEGEKICCMSNIDGGRYGAWFRKDGSVDNPCREVKDI